MSSRVATATSRQELHGFIDILPERSIQAVKSLLEVLTDDNWTPVIETDLSEEEPESAKAGLDHYRKSPDDFISLGDLKAKVYGKQSA
ncbi:hypothetical protein AGMMS50229_14710 [Campylobacterota bacterium]|nr:hypothetical protein AGMMS50229_14710 [Campylobacterota bacterium]